MLDIRIIRERSEEVQQAAQQKRINFEVKELLAIDERRRELLAITENLRAERNRRSDDIKRLLGEIGKKKPRQRERLPRRCLVS